MKCPINDYVIVGSSQENGRYAYILCMRADTFKEATERAAMFEETNPHMCFTVMSAARYLEFRKQHTVIEW